MFSVNQKVEIFWGDSRISTSRGEVIKVTPKFVLLKQGAIRSQWIPRHIIRQVTVEGVTVGDANTWQYM
jgi:hypothetical protein